MQQGESPTATSHPRTGSNTNMSDTTSMSPSVAPSTSTSTSSLRSPRSRRSSTASSAVHDAVKKRERQCVLDNYWARPSPYELDVVDKGDHFSVSSCSADVAGWWIGTLRAAYPQDHYSGDGSSLKMHPAMGVTLKLNKNDGTLKIKGKKHLQWFKENFETVLESGGKGFAAIAEMGKVVDRYMKLDDGMTVPRLLELLPPCGGIKHGPTFIYRLWKGLLDQWSADDADVYVVTPLLDAKRVADLMLVLVKHRLSRSQMTLLTTQRCDSEDKFPKVFKHAKDMLRDLKAPNKKRLVVEERLKLALERLEVKYGSFHCRFIAAARGDTTEMMLTSANFHNWHFYYDHSDLVVYLRMPTEDFRCNYLEPLGIALPDIGQLGTRTDSESTLENVACESES